MGSDRHYPDEAPAHRVQVDGFWIDSTTVTNALFRKFVEATGYVTIAERPIESTSYPQADPKPLRPGSLLFQKPTGPVDLRNIANWWAYVVGANWRQPEGPGSRIDGRKEHPVVHITYEDALTYASWAGKDLPTEAEWEFAARGGLDGAAYCWGDEFAPDGKLMANTWHGIFPWENKKPIGLQGTTPVGSFPPNGYGLFDMCGNVWQWTRDWHAPHQPDAGRICSIPSNPRGGKLYESFDPAQPDLCIPRRVIKGGSFLCAPNYCMRFRPAARQAQAIDTSTCHVGFRCVVR
jgi:formylglycine-generating enzyme required for sulfatase activity